MFKRSNDLWSWMAWLAVLAVAWVLAPSMLLASLIPGLLFLPVLASFLFCSPRSTALMAAATAAAQTAVVVANQARLGQSLTALSLAAAMTPAVLLYGGAAAMLGLYRRRARRQLRRFGGAEDAAVAELAGGVAHDLSNMLSIALGTVRILLRSEKLSETARTDLETVNDTVRSGAHLVRQLMGVISGRPSVSESVEINAVLMKIARQVRPTLPTTFDLRLSPFPYPLAIRGSGVQLQRCLLNLYMNAREAAGDDGWVELRADRRVVGAAQAARYGVAPGEYAVASVVDDGPGMSATTRGRMFLPFFTTRRHGRGHGLGLSIVEDIAAKAKGFVEAASRPGEGSRFDVYLPLVHEASAPQRSVEMSPAEAATVVLSS